MGECAATVCLMLLPRRRTVCVRARALSDVFFSFVHFSASSFDFIQTNQLSILFCILCVLCICWRGSVLCIVNCTVIHMKCSKR